MNAGASTSAVPSPIEGSGTAWVLLGSWALSPARPTPIHPRHECRGFSALLGEDEATLILGRNVSLYALIGFRGLMLQAVSEKHNSFLRPLKKKDFKE